MESCTTCSAILGCPTCSLLLQSVVTGCLASSIAIEKVDGIRRCQPASSGFSLFLENNLIHFTVFTENPLRGSPASQFQLSAEKRLPGDTASEATFATLASWISRCLTSHPRCHRTRSGTPGFYPKRLLDLRNERVALREDDVETDLYACLSHCWGTGEKLLKTTEATIDKFRSGIPWQTLPKTFQDAILICRRLGIPHLWIDSLCIIQANKADWIDQSAKMADIYENAFLTIAATKSPDSLGGCFSETSPGFLGSAVPGYPGVFVRQPPPAWPDHWNARQDNPKWPLLNRGWVYQEMRLSPRVLHFCAEEVIWECHSERCSESARSDKDLGTDHGMYDHQMYTAVPYWRLERRPRLLWYRTVQEYSLLHLTFESDKLPALAALTQRMQQLRVDDKFILGLWEKTLLFDLLWFVWPSPTGHPPISDNSPRYPSWSWASIPSQVMWDTATAETLDSAQIQTVQLTSSQPSHMGIASEANITLRVQMIESRQFFRGERVYRDSDYLRNRGSPSAVDEIKDRVHRLPNLGNMGHEALLKELTLYNYKSDRSVAVGLPKPQLDAYYLPIGRNRYRPNDIAGLYVRKKEGTDKFERIGYGEIRHVIGRQLKEFEHSTRGSLGTIDRAVIKELEDVLSTRMDFILAGVPSRLITLV